MHINFRPLAAGDDPAILRILDSRADYFATRGTRPEHAHALLSRLPQGATPAQKRLLAIESDGAVVGIVDAVIDYPTVGAAFVALFALDPAGALHGMAVPVVSLLGERALAEGVTTVYTECPVGWPPGETLLGQLGYRPGQSAQGMRTWAGQIAAPPPLPW